ncbi:MAG TPA: ATP-binding protein [Verrucomicrobiae bacterium]|nr:ATP-binding protein [Verrucomicrobiae bacterium]
MSGTTNNSSLEQISQLVSANRLKTELIANVSHELRTPVHAIIGYTELLLEGVYGSLTDDQKETVNYIRESASDLLSLISNLLDISKIESGKTDLILGTFDLRDLITELFGQLKPLADAKELALDSRVLVSDTVVRTDRGKLKQVFTNILGNALKFTDSGTVTLTIEPARVDTSPAPPTHRDRLVVRIQDTGIGIPADKLDRIFEKFYQINSSANRTYGGAGLGLYITKQLLNLLAATIDVESVPGKGTLVTVTLPKNFEEIEGIHRLRRRIADASAGNTEAPADGSRLVLVVSDNPDTARILSDGLGSAEYNVYVTAANSEAVALARKLRPIVILLNSEASSSEFWSVFQELKSQPETKDIPTIFLGNAGVHGLGAPLTVAAPLKRHEVLRSIRAVTKTGKKNVLIVDDDESFREILKCALSEEGYQISEAETGTQAIDLLTKRKPDVVLLDLHIPEIDGWGVLRLITQHPELKDVEVLVISGDMLDDKEAAAINARSSGFICKADFKVNAVLEKVANLLEVN